MRRSVRGWSKRLAVFAGAGLSIFIIGVLTAGWILTRPVQEQIGEPPVDLGAQKIHFVSRDNTIVNGWWCPVAPSRGSILLLPGIRANRLSMVGRADFLRRAGFSVLLIDLRATGETAGKRITFGWEERSDVLAAVDFLRGQDSGVKIGVIGSSLGGAAALFATPPLRVDGLVIEAVYPSIARATRNRLQNYFGSLGPRLAPLLLGQLRVRLGISAKELSPVNHLPAIHCPVLVIGGANDHNTTVEDTSRIFAAANQPKELWLIENAGHVDLHRFAAEKYEKTVIDFFARSFAAP